MRKPELLSPAGSFASLEAAIEGGADAVYLGAHSFNARMRAENFSADDMSAALSLCSSYGVRSYVTLNTRLFDDELGDALRLAAELYEKGASALIVADMGLVRLIRRHIPSLEIHASTQLSGHSVADAKALFDAGFSRMVCQREISEKELSYLCENSPVEIEMFIHGAHCVSFSGQCLMSAVLGGRSGNRGECAQPCRQPYYQNGRRSYPLSLRDMCLAGHMTKIAASGVSSLKIEGRQKSPEYVLGVTKIYRRLLDEERDAAPDEVEELKNLFSRGGFTDGYFVSDRRNMLGVRTLEEFYSSEKTAFGGLTKKVPLEMTLTVNDGEPPTLTARSPFKTVTVTGDVPDAAVSPLTKEGALKNASRLGNTPYYLDKFTFTADGNAALTLSGLNALRRSAVSALCDASREAVKLPCVSLPREKKPGGETFTAEFLFADRITPLAEEFFDKIYLPCGAGDGKHGTVLPPYLSDGSWDRVWDSVSGDLLVHSAAELTEAKRRGLCASLSLRGNVFNSGAAEYYADMGAGSVTFAPEMRLSKIRDAGCPAECAAAVYGRLPLMLCVRCAISDGGKNCSGKKTGICASSLSDRYRIEFPVFGLPDCTNVIYNSVPVYMADKMDEVRAAGITCFHFIFTDETPAEADRIINAYKNGTPPDKKNIRRML